jgi:group II intron reverse transcriptase/maturase
MRNAETIFGIIRNRGERGVPVENVYRQLFNRELYLHAYSRLYGNDGAMTPGTTNETVDGMSLEKVDNIIEKLRYEKYRWTPVRRVMIPKLSQPGKYRSLGLPTWSDKLFQEVIRSILEAYYEPQFSRHSHGFRAQRGCHTALREIQKHWRGVKWFIEGDISKCFDSMDHNILLSILNRNFHDNRFLRLISNLFKAGYMENWKYNATLSGVPQGSIVGPIFSNIYLNEFDQFVESRLLPTYNQGNRRKRNSLYDNLISNAYAKRTVGKYEEAKLLRKAAQQMPSFDPQDPDFRRLWYVRYADDWLLGFIGTQEEAEAIKCKISKFLLDELKLELSLTKTLTCIPRGLPRYLTGKFELVFPAACRGTLRESLKTGGFQM